MTDAELDAALACGKLIRQTEPRASAARYDHHTGRVVVEPTNGCTFAFPPRLARASETATPNQPAEVARLGTGSGLHQETLDMDLSVPGLLAGRFGTKAFMARQAGRATSPAKADAARRNDARGGRPRRSA